MFCRLQWAEMLGYMLDPQNPEDLLRKVPSSMVTDAKSLYDAVQKGMINTSGLGLTEKYSSLELRTFGVRRDGRAMGRQSCTISRCFDQAPSPKQSAQCADQRHLDLEV